MPPLRAGMRVGLLGGSFDPAHAGHAAISLRALRQARLDWVCWLPAARHPIKPELRAPFAERLATARRLVGHPLRRIWVSGMEAQAGAVSWREATGRGEGGVARQGVRYTVETVAFLQRRFPGVRFLLLLGADNLAQLPRWHRWEDLLGMIPLLVAPRRAEPGSEEGRATPAGGREAGEGREASAREGGCRFVGYGAARARLSGRILPAERCFLLAETPPPVLSFLSGEVIPISSTRLRREKTGL